MKIDTHAALQHEVMMKILILKSISPFRKGRRNNEKKLNDETLTRESTALEDVIFNYYCTFRIDVHATLVAPDEDET
jgi:hypothetical protein